MYKVIVEKECGCFRRSAMDNNIEVASKDEALLKSIEMCNLMNEEFCGKHNFTVEEREYEFIIKMQNN